jgi:Fur family ferric uptake transcriptional regulator
VALSPSQAPLRAHGIRLTRQRQLLFDIIHNAHAHLNADQIYGLARKKNPKINRVTVYRTLKLLKHEGLVDELDLMHYEGEHHYYETRLKREHAHMVCVRCGAVQEYFGKPLHEMKREVETQFGFKVLMARTEVGGICPDCQRTDVEEVSALEKQFKPVMEFPVGGDIQAPLKDHGIRLTRQREVIFEIIHNAREHLNADQICALANEQDAKINRVTVYRTLKLLKLEGLIDELDLMHYEGEQHYYETRLKPEHAHLVCLRSGRVQEYFGEPLKHVRREIESQFGIKVLIVRTEFGGLSADFQAVDSDDQPTLQNELKAVSRKVTRSRHSHK